MSATDRAAAAAAADAGEGAGKPRKAPNAFRTISEVADDLHIPQHVLRFWESKFNQVKPLKRGGGRRYYRPDDIALLRRISALLYIQGYTIKGVQRLLREGGGRLADEIPPASPAEQAAAAAERVRDPELPGLPPGTPPGSSAGAGAAGARARPKHEPEVERLRGLLTETLHALEEIRDLLT
jgi:DNA-binding transcriptional MerR regulator